MIVFFGPAGAGKSVQGQLLAARNGWRWLSAGQLLRDSKSEELHKIMSTGKLVPFTETNKLIAEALSKAENVPNIILDGYPRQLEQAEWLVEHAPEYGRSITLVIVLEVPRSELIKRLTIRGRVDDTPEAIDERLRLYRKVMYPVLSYFTDKNINIAHIDGVGTVGQVHDRVVEELDAHGLVSVK